MKILVLSDSHGNEPNLQLAFDRTEPDVVLFLGDGEADFEEFCLGPAQLADTASVRGNCDWDSAKPAKRTVEYGGYRFFLTHGHNYNVKFDTMRLYYAAREAMADVALYGHTHIPHCQLEGGLWMLNPGTISGLPRATYGLITIENGILDCQVHTLEV